MWKRKMVIKKCCVSKCKSKSTRKEDVRVTYHKFPKAVSVRDAWFEVTRLAHIDPPTYVCSRHFLLTDFQHTQGRYVLKSGAVPSIFPWTNMDELDSLKPTEGALEDEQNTSSSSKDSEPENLEAIKDFIAKHDMKASLSVKEEIQIDPEKTIDVKPDIHEDIHDSSTDSSIPSNKGETLAIANSVMDFTLNESTDNLSKNNESTEETTSANDKGTNSVALTVGSKVDARDFSESWYSAEIVEVDYDEMEVLVRFDSDTKKSEEWICVNSPRLRPMTTVIKSAEMKAASNDPDEKNIKVKKADQPEGILTDKEEENVEVKPKLTYAVGERCLARWRDNRRFVATVQNDLGNGTYEIIFDDGFHWKCSANRLSKLKDSFKTDSSSDSRNSSTPSPTPSTSAIVPEATFHKHLFDPTRDYLGSKSERRELKRKLNIKEIFNIGQKQRKKEPTIKEEKHKITTQKKPRNYRLKVKTEIKREIKLENNDVPDAIASIIGTVDKRKETTSVKKKVDNTDKEKRNEGGNNICKEDIESSDNEVLVLKDNQVHKLKNKYIDDDGEESVFSVDNKADKTSNVVITDEDTQSVKMSDGESDMGDDDDVDLSGDAKLSDDQDGKMSLDKIAEADRLQNFEKLDGAIHAQVIGRIKEAINKLEGGLNRKLDADVTKVEEKIDSKRLAQICPEIPPEINEIEQEKEVNQETNKVDEKNKFQPETNEFRLEFPGIKQETVTEVSEETNDVIQETNDVIQETNEINQETNEIKQETNEVQQETNEVEQETNELKHEVPEKIKIKLNKKTKKFLKYEQRIKALEQEKAGAIESFSSRLENMKKEMENIRMMFSNKEIPESYLMENEWCCRWVNGEPIGTVVETEPDVRIDVLNKVALPKKTVQVEDKRLPEGWSKLMVRRSLGYSAGKWDVVLVNPEKRRFHTKTDMRHYLENNPDPTLKSHENALLDFAVHLKLARRMGWVAGDSRHASRALNRPLSHKRKMKRGDKERRSKKRKLGADGTYKFERSSLPTTSDTPLLDSSGNMSFDNSTLEDGYVYVGSLKVQVIDNLLRCPADGCFKNFRNNTLLQMHIKHYHRELRESLGATPKVLDLAYARTAPIETETKPRHEPESKIIKVKIPRPPKRTDESKLDTKEVNTVPQVPSPVPCKIPLRGKIPRSLDSPMMRQLTMQQSNRPVKRPKVLLPVRRPEPGEPPQELAPMDQLPDFALDSPILLEPRISLTPLPILDFERTISTHTVSKPSNVKRRREKRKVFATISKAPPPSDEEDVSEMNSDVDTKSSCPNSGSPDLKTKESKSVVRKKPRSSESNEDSNEKATATYICSETGEEIKLERMKREEIINCHCGFREEDGLMVQCELCLCWQHALCHNIHRVSEVPHKYTCWICLNPRRGRRSQRFLHDQDRVYEGVLPGARASLPLRRAHDLTANLLMIADSLHALRVKYNVATKKNHPKLYLWAKDWDVPEVALPQDNQNAYSDLNLVINDIANTSGFGKQGMQAKTEGTSCAEDFQLPADDQLDRLSQNGSLSNHSLLGGLLASPGGPSLEMPISTSELERLAKSVQEQAEARPVVVAPQPEAAIENGACRERLLRHVRRCQVLIDARLDTLEAEIVELEAHVPSFADDETADFCPRTKQTVQMLLRDLHSLEQLGLIT